MFDAEFWKEIIAVIKGQKLRCFLTSFSIFWSMFLLVILLGCGNGFKNGIFAKMGAIPSNCVYFMTGPASENGTGIEKNGIWQIDKEDIGAVRLKYGDKLTKLITTKKYSGDSGGYFNAESNGRNHISIVKGTDAGFLYVSRLKIIAGRDINEFDCRQARKVCVIGERIVAGLFSSAQEAVGQIISLEGSLFEVVGVCRKTNPYFSFGNVQETIYVPFSTGSLIFDTGSDADALFCIFEPEADTKDLRNGISSLLIRRHGLCPSDKTALHSNTTERTRKQYASLYQGISILLWLVGIGTLLAGFIGVGNIMMITVRERRRDIGIMRSAGASPSFIKMQFDCESLVLSLSAGFSGIVAGYWAMFVLGRAIGPAASEMFSNPCISPFQALAALAILIAGALAAGSIPADRALKEKIIETLKQD